MRKRVEEFIKEHKMLKAGDRVIVGVSGGADSVCLLQLLMELRESLEVEVRAVHVHHGLRGAEADRDAEFVEKMCERLGVACLVVHRDVRKYAAEREISEEEAGRELRYQIFEDAAAAWSEEVQQCSGEIRTAAEQQCGGRIRIAVAHHREDQAETILHNLFRGSGLKGLGGMAPVRGRVIRPLLCVTRAEIVEYLEKRELAYCVDSTNETLDYTRNRLRNHLIPEICREINAGAVEHIVSAGERLAQADAYFEHEAGKLWKEYGCEEQKQEEQCKGNQTREHFEAVPGRCGIPAEKLLVQPKILQGYIIRRMILLRTSSMKDITSTHVEQILELAKKGTGKRISLPYGLTAWIEYGILWIRYDDSAEAVDKEKRLFSLSMSHFPYEKHQKIPQNQYTKWFDYDKIKDALSVRTRQTGDFITLADGRHKSVKSFMIDAKIPRQRRDEILLLAEGSHVLWIVGYRISEYYKVTENTKTILQVEADGGKEHGR